MGQTSLPVLNRTGYSTFWQSVWDDKFNYTRGWKEDHYFRHLVPFLFSDKVTRSKLLLNYNTIRISLLLSKYKNVDVFEETGDLFKHINFCFGDKKKTKHFILRIWIIKFQTWFLFFFKIYTPSFKKKILIKHGYNQKIFLGYYHLFLSLQVFNSNYLKCKGFNKFDF